jgi:hypothetical protein
MRNFEDLRPKFLMMFMVNGELKNKKFPWKLGRNKKISLTIHIFNLSEISFRKSTGSLSPLASSQLGFRISNRQAGNLQLMLVPNNQTPTNNAPRDDCMEFSKLTPEGAGEKSAQGEKRKADEGMNNPSFSSNQVQHSLMVPISTQMVGVFNFQAQDFQAYKPQWKFQPSSLQIQQWQQQTNPFYLSETLQHTSQSFNLFC